MMDEKTKNVVRALLIQFKEVMDKDDSAQQALVDNVEQALSESSSGSLGPCRLTGVRTLAGVELFFALQPGAPRLWEKVLELVRSERVVNLYIEEYPR